MHFLSSLNLVVAFTIFATSIQASPVRSFSLCMLYFDLSYLVYLYFTPQVPSRVELLNSRDLSVVAVRNENVGLLFFLFPSAIAPLIFVVQ